MVTTHNVFTHTPACHRAAVTHVNVTYYSINNEVYSRFLILFAYNSIFLQNSLPDAPNALVKHLHTNDMKLLASLAQQCKKTHCAILAVWLCVKKIQLCVYIILKKVFSAALLHAFVILTAIVHRAMIHCAQIFSPAGCAPALRVTVCTSSIPHCPSASQRQQHSILI